MIEMSAQDAIELISDKRKQAVEIISVIQKQHQWICDLQAQTEKLQQQIEAMKCCGNCKNWHSGLCITTYDKKETKRETTRTDKCNEWEICE